MGNIFQRRGASFCTPLLRPDGLRFFGSQPPLHANCTYFVIFTQSSQPNNHSTTEEYALPEMSQSPDEQAAGHRSLDLYIPPCIHSPPHRFHPPPVDQPLRIRIQGPLETIRKALPDEVWHPPKPFPQPGGLQLARLTYQSLFGSVGNNTALKIRDEYLAWVIEAGIPQKLVSIPRYDYLMIVRTNYNYLSYFDYYGVTFDHLIQEDDTDPEVLVINIIEVDGGGGAYADGGIYAQEVLSFPVDPREYTGRKVLAVPRCCQRKKGTQDRKLINQQVAERESLVPGTLS